MFRKFSDCAHNIPLKFYDSYMIIGHGSVNCVNAFAILFQSQCVLFSIKCNYSIYRKCVLVIFKKKKSH